MDSIIWLFVAVKIFVVFWLIYYIFDRRKKKGTPQPSLSVTEEGIVTTYAGAPVTQIPKDYVEYNQQQLYAASANGQVYVYENRNNENQQSNILTTKS